MNCALIILSASNKIKYSFITLSLNHVLRVIFNNNENMIKVNYSWLSLCWNVIKDV